MESESSLHSIGSTEVDGQMAPALLEEEADVTRDGIEVVVPPVASDMPLADDKKPRIQRRTRQEMAERVPLADLIRTLTHPESGMYPKGVTPKQLDDYVTTMPPSQRPTRSKNHLQVVLCRQVTDGKIVRASNGHYIALEYSDAHVAVTPPKRRRRRPPVVPTVDIDTVPSAPVDNLTVEPAPKRIRVGRDRSRKTTGAITKRSSPKVKSDTQKNGAKKKSPPVKSQSNSPHHSPKSRNVCDYCLVQRRQNVYGQPETVLVCHDCNARAHPTCMGYSYEQAVKARARPWQCIDCKTCLVCHDAHNVDKGDLLFCNLCGAAYHATCHSPEVVERPTDGVWVCCQCEEKPAIVAKTTVCNGLNKDALGSEDSKPLPAKKADPQELFIIPGKQVQIVQSAVAEANSWTIDDVAQFIERLGFAQEAQAFKFEEIDGSSLLLLRRSDVLSRMKIPLGPALKIYARLYLLQRLAASKERDVPILQRSE